MNVTTSGLNTRTAPQALPGLAFLLSWLLLSLSLPAVTVAAEKTPVQTASSEPVASEIEELRQQLESLRRAQDSLGREVREIRALLQRLVEPPVAAPAPAARHELSIAGRPYRGPRDADVVLVEFSDYQCEACARHFVETWPEINRQFIQAGRLRYVVKSFPSEQSHPQAFKAHEAAACAAEQEKFWEMHAELFANQSALEPEHLRIHADGIGLNILSFDKCMDSGRHADVIRGDLEEGLRGGIRGAPVFAFGSAVDGGRSMQVTGVLAGVHSYPEFQRAIEAAGLAPQPSGEQ